MQVLIESCNLTGLYTECFYVYQLVNIVVFVGFLNFSAEGAHGSALGKCGV